MKSGGYGKQELQIIAAARRLFVEKGFEETTMCDIAEAADVNRSTLHYYFANKDVMFRAVFSSIVETLMPRLQEIMGRRDMPMTTRLSLVVDEYFNRFLENPYIPGFIISEIQRDVDHFIATARDMHYDKVFSIIRDSLRAEMDAGRLRKVPMYMVFTAFYGNIAFPFITKNLFVSWFNMSEDDYREMIMEWKKYVLLQVNAVLTGMLPDGAASADALPDALPAAACNDDNV